MLTVIRSGLLLFILALPVVQADAATFGVEVVFSSNEATTIRAYYSSQNTRSTSHGKGGKSLPPGIEKNLARGKALPPGIAKQGLPAGLLTLLPPAPKGYERILVSGKVLLVEIATQVIHDVLEDIVFR